MIKVDKESCADYNNCYFADPGVNWNASLSLEAGTGTVVFDSTAHRKIRLYRAVNNGFQGSGHGTHTMGSLLGAPFNASDTYSVDYRHPPVCPPPSPPPTTTTLQPDGLTERHVISPSPPLFPRCPTPPHPTNKMLFPCPLSLCSCKILLVDLSVYSLPASSLGMMLLP